MANNIDWDAFKYNSGREGLQKRFEDLCRQIFFEKYADKDKYQITNIYPLYVENNPGLETDPIIYNGKKVGFQAKFFTSNSSNKFSQLKKSADQIVKHYNDKVDTVIFYVNEPVNENTRNKINNILAGIEVEYCCGNIVLDKVRESADYIQSFYFGCVSFNHQWFLEKFRKVEDEINPDDYLLNNVETVYERHLSIFTCSNRGAEIFNSRKRKTLSFLRDKSLDYEWKDYAKYIFGLINIIENIWDVDECKIKEVLNWNNTIIKTDCYKHLIKEWDSLKEEAEKEKDSNDFKYLADKVIKIQEILNAVDIVSPDNSLVDCLNKKILVVTGRGGFGKTHSLLHEVLLLLREERNCIYIRGYELDNASDFSNRILELLNISFSSMDDFLDCLEISAANNNGRLVTIIIDGLNECSGTSSKIKTWLGGLIKKISRKEYVRLIISCRDEYTSALIPESDLCEKVSIEGFSSYENGIKEMLKMYDIPFSPSFLFNAEANSPLFCKLYCLNYKNSGGSIFSLNQLFDNILKDASERSSFKVSEALCKVALPTDYNWPKVVVHALADKQVEMKKNSLTLSEISSLPMWTSYGLSPKGFLDVLVERGILFYVGTDLEGKYNFTYQKFRDFYLAENIIEKNKTKEEVKEYIRDYVLPEKGGAVNDFTSADLFSQVAYLYANKFGEECNDLIENRNDLGEYKREYIKSFSWRRDNTLSAEDYFKIAQSYGLVSTYDFWSSFISNAIKIGSNLNADALHRILFPLSVAYRDYIWTIPVSSTEDGENVFNIFNDIADGSYKIEFKEYKEKELFLTMSSWFLTSTNRILRDTVSKAMIVVLLDDTSLCEELLRKFENVNDLYILERLYEITFGVVTRSENIDESSYASIVEYIYDFVFNEDEVYPDVVIRDASYYIIKYYIKLFKGGDSEEFLKINPPYHSAPIDRVSLKEYKSKGKYSGYNRILGSMAFDIAGRMYGDFGRYVFQTSLPDGLGAEELKNIHGYALNLIFEKYGYSDEYFDVFDRKVEESTYSRTSPSFERIGKKYQWLCYNETLSRVHDAHSFDIYNNNEELSLSFRFRTFDPTVSYKISERNVDNDINEHYKNLYSKMFKEHIISSSGSGEWIIDNSELKQLIKELVINVNGNEWVNLCMFPVFYAPFVHDDKSEESLTCTIKIFAAFIPKKDFTKLSNLKKKEIKFATKELTEFVKYPYNAYVRAYPWDDKGIRAVDAHNEYLQLETYDNKTISLFGSFPAVCEINGGFDFDNSEKEESAVGHLVPCPQLIDFLGLKLKSNSDYKWFSGEDLVCSYYHASSEINGLLISKDSLGMFLKEMNMNLVWFVFTDKTSPIGYGQYEGFVKYMKRGEVDDYIFNVT